MELDAGGQGQSTWDAGEIAINHQKKQLRLIARDIIILSPRITRYHKAIGEPLPRGACVRGKGFMGHEDLSSYIGPQPEIMPDQEMLLLNAQLHPATPVLQKFGQAQPKALTSPAPDRAPRSLPRT